MLELVGLKLFSNCLNCDWCSVLLRLIKKVRPERAEIERGSTDSVNSDDDEIGGALREPFPVGEDIAIEGMEFLGVEAGLVL